MENKKKEVGSRVLQDYRLSVWSLGGMQMMADIIADTSRTDHCVNIEERSKHFDREGLLKILEKFHFRVVYKDDSDAYYVAPCNSTIFIRDVGDYIHTLRGAVRSEIYEDLGSFISNSPEIPIEPRLAYLNQKGAIREHTFSANPFEPDNYAPSVIEDMNHVRKSFEGDGSYGRIAILSGPPGTGKTHLVTYMLGWNVLPIYIPSSSMASLSSPIMIDAITNYDSNDLPILLILEDGDQAIFKRSGSDFSSSLVSDLLNFGDGLLGKLLNLRIVVTSNLKKKEVDSAITRPGRLCRYIDVNPLEPSHANRVFQRLTKNKESPYKEPTTLATVYSEALGKGYVPPPPMTQQTIGFRRKETQYSIPTERWKWDDDD